MKFVFCTQRYVPPMVSGVDVLTYRVVSRLTALGNEVHVVAVDVTGESTSLAVKYDFMERIPLVRISYDLRSRASIEMDTLRDDAIGEFFESFLASERPDVFVLMNLYGISASPIESARKLGIPVIMILTDFLAMCRRGNLVKWNGQICETGESIKSCAACFLSHNPIGRLGTQFLSFVPERLIVDGSDDKDRLTSLVLNPLRSYWNQVRLMRTRIEYLKSVFSYLDKVLVANQFAYDICRRSGFSSDQLEILTWPIDTRGPLADIVHRTVEHVRFLFIGRYHPFKGPHLLIEAFKRLKRKNGATLTLYGAPDSGHESYALSLQDAVKGNTGIELKGPIENSRLFEIFSEADYFVLPSIWHENNTLVIPDALLSQTPVISSNIRGVVHLVKDGENGFLFEMGNIQDLSEKMQLVIDQHPQMFHRLSRPWIDAMSIEEYGDRFVSISNTVIKGGKATLG